MLFNSYDFLFGFLPLTLAAHAWVLARYGARRAGLLLCAASLIFYAWWYVPYLLLLLASVALNFQIGLRLGDDTRSDDNRRRLLQAGVAFNLALLGFYKYLGWGLESLEALTGLDLPAARFALPLGISFYTFQQIAYLVDARQGRCREHDFADYLLFVAFFPQLIAGPIVHHGEVLPQLREGRTPSDHDRAVGLTFFAAGLAKKVLVADALAPWVDATYARAEAGEPISSALAWQGLMAWHFQLYFDFSGYSDMAIGLARLFGIRLPANFDAPYRCTSFADFWRRWHLTLSRFLRDYVYIPLGGNRGGPARRRLNLAITLFLAGVWHGAGWTFFWWAVMMAAYIAINDLFRQVTGGLPDTLTGSAFGGALTWFGLIVSWPLFRGDSMQGARILWEAMFFVGDGGIGKVQGSVIATFAALTAFVLLVPTSQQWLRRADPVLDFRPIDRLTWPDALTWAPTSRWAALTALLLLATIPVLDRANAFLYWAF